MHISHPIEVQGRFVGIAVADAWRFVATDPMVEDIGRATLPSPAEALRVATLALNRSRRSAGRATETDRP